MGIFDALNTAVGCLQSQSFALQNISGNIANASTVGYKGINTNFEDLVAQSSTPTSQVAGGVTALSQQTITTEGTVSSSTVATNMAINGDGFFSVQKPTSIVDNQPVFNSVTDYTRAGDFQVNANGNLVNGAGYYLMGVSVHPKTATRSAMSRRPPVPERLCPGAARRRHPVRRQPSDRSGHAGQPRRGPPKSIVAAGGLNTNDFGTNPTALRHAGAARQRHHHRHGRQQPVGNAGPDYGQYIIVRHGPKQLTGRGVRCRRQHHG